MAGLRKHIILANEIRKDILAGRYGMEGGLPGLDELTRRSGLARNTVRSALLILEGEKVIVERDRNYFVNSPVVTTMTQYVWPVAVRMQQYARKGEIRNVGEVRRIQLPEHLVDKVGLTPPVTVVLQLCTSVEIGDQEETPMQIARYYYFMPLTDDQIQHMQNDARYDVLLECPEDLVRQDQIFPRMPTNEEIEILKVPAGMPVLNVLSTVLDENGTVLLFQDLTRVPRAMLEYRYSFKNRPVKKTE